MPSTKKMTEVQAAVAEFFEAQREEKVAIEVHEDAQRKAKTVNDALAIVRRELTDDQCDPLYTITSFFLDKSAEAETAVVAARARYRTAKHVLESL